MAKDTDSKDDDGVHMPQGQALTATATATERLRQVSAHLSDQDRDKDKKNQKENTGTLSQRKNKKQPRKSPTNLPADYSDVLSQISTLRTIATTPNAQNRGYIRQKQAGKLWVRERIEQLLDAGSFQEVGSISGTVAWKQTSPLREEPVGFIPSNNVQGTGLLGGRRILLTADDFSIRGGHADGATAEKTVYLEKLSVALKLPMVKLVDGSSGGGSVTTIKKMGWSYLPMLPQYKYVVQQLNMGIPNLGAVVGPAVRYTYVFFVM